MDRRAFLGRMALAGVAIAGQNLLRATGTNATVVAGVGPYGPLLAADANGVQLPAGFTSRVIATTGPVVAGTTYTWHTAPDGGACFVPRAAVGCTCRTPRDRPGRRPAGPLRGRRHDRRRLPRSSAGTIINCAGGATPWGTWLSCEENGRAGRSSSATRTQPRPGVRPAGAWARFKHEAAAVDPVTGPRLPHRGQPGRGACTGSCRRRPGDLTAGYAVGPTSVVRAVVGHAGSRSATSATRAGGQHHRLQRGRGGLVRRTAPCGSRPRATAGCGSSTSHQQLSVLYDAATTPGPAAHRRRQHHPPRAVRSTCSWPRTAATWSSL